MVAKVDALLLQSVSVASAPPMTPAPASVRERLLGLVRDAPGLNKSRLQSHLGVAWGTVAYHVRILVAAGLIDAEAHGRDVFLYPSGLPEHPRRQARALRTPEANRVLDALGQANESYLVEISQRSGLSRKVVRRRLAELMQAGLVHDKGLRRARYALQRPGNPEPGPDDPWLLNMRGPPRSGSPPWHQP